MGKAIQKYLVGTSYPPEDHILRDLAIEVETEDTTSQAIISAPVTPQVCKQNGVLYAGVDLYNPGIKGPFETKTELIRSDNQHASMRVDVLERGDADRLMAIIFNACDQVNTE